MPGHSYGVSLIYQMVDIHPQPRRRKTNGDMDGLEVVIFICFVSGRRSSTTSSNANHPFPLSLRHCRQIVLEPEQLELPAPGIQELVLTRKPPAELHPSKQKLVQGMLKISLESSREAAVAERAVAKGIASSSTSAAADTRLGSMVNVCLLYTSPSPRD